MKISDLKSYKVLGSESALQSTKPRAEEQKSLEQKVLDAGTSVSNFFGGKGVADLAGATIAKANAKPDEKQFVEFPTAKEVAGSAIQLGANFVPGVGVGGKLATKVGAGLATGYALDVGSKLQNKDKSVGEALVPGVGTAVGGALPVAGAVVGLGTKILGRLTKGLGSGLSGVSTKTIDSIVENPKVAQQVSKTLAKEGNSVLLEKNAKEIINGVSTIRQQARKAFGDGLETLAESDITPKTFKEGTKQVLDKYGSTIEKGKRVLSGVEFEDPKNIKKASELIDRLSNTSLDGKSLRKLADDIENAAYKTATSDERLSFNAFIKDLSGTLTDSIKKSTPKLDEINKAFSQDMQLTQAVEDIFGKVNYKNLSEVVKASQKLETLFAKKGLAPNVIDNFLKRIGVDAGDFKTSEAVRQISDKATGANTKGLSVGEMIQQATSAVITPQLVRDIAIKTGIADTALAPFLTSLKGLSPALQKSLIQALLQDQQ